MSPMQSATLDLQDVHVPSNDAKRIPDYSQGSLLWNSDEQVRLSVKERKPPQSATRHINAHEFLRAVERHRTAVCEIDGAQAAMQWIIQNSHQYEGRWVALLGDSLVAVGDSAAEVYQQISIRPDLPFVIRINPRQNVPFAGW